MGRRRRRKRKRRNEQSCLGTRLAGGRTGLHRGHAGAYREHIWRLIGGRDMAGRHGPRRQTRRRTNKNKKRKQESTPGSLQVTLLHFSSVATSLCLLGSCWSRRQVNGPTRE